MVVDHVVQPIVPFGRHLTGVEIESHLVVVLDPSIFAEKVSESRSSQGRVVINFDLAGKQIVAYRLFIKYLLP